jgi:predicted nuclease of predicted toxin-antitoxin system
MKLLFDHNLSPRLAKQLSDLFPDSDHVYPLGMDTRDDREIREFAAAEGFTIVTKDADYGEMHALLGGPPKVIWVRRGNCSTSRVASILRIHFEEICHFETDPESGVLTLF